MARHDGRVLCQSRTPFLSAARVLLAEGHDPEETLEMSREGADMVDLKGPLGVAAGLAVQEGARQGPRFAKASELPECFARSG